MIHMTTSTVPERTDGSGIIACMDRTFSDYLLWWKPGGNGYTHNIDKAGRYTREEYERAVSPDARAKHVLVPFDEAARLSERVVDHWNLKNALKESVPIAE